MLSKLQSVLGVTLILLTFCCPDSKLAHAAEPGTDVVLRQGLVLPPMARAGRTAFHTDDVEAQIVKGVWAPPLAGQSVPGSINSKRAWEPATAQPDGTFTNSALRGGYLYVQHESDSARPMLLEASGHSMVYVNGEPRTGDPYQNGTTTIPFLLLKGTNHFLFSAGRGHIKARLSPPSKAVKIELRDQTLPDIVKGLSLDAPAAVILVNSSTNELTGLQIRATAEGGKTMLSPIPSVGPMSFRKVGFRLKHSGLSPTNSVRFHLELLGKQGTGNHALDQAEVFLRLRTPEQTRKETFISDIDGSVQYYAVTPAQPDQLSGRPPALVLSTHGAGVEGLGQASAYAPKSWAHIVAPTNRRPYGFDWEDWGRLDAIEVLEIAKEKLHSDPARTYLTGHSMGGHGAWQLSAVMPARFAAVAPSAGWISFFSYAGGRRFEGTNELMKLVQRASNPSDTLLMASNYLHHGIYILHGDADDNVPVREARSMKSVLEKFHHDFDYHEQPGAGHWWGNACVDWPPIFDLFARHAIPSDSSVRHLSFTTVNPGVSSESHWISIDAQEKALEKSVVEADWDPVSGSFKASTRNVRRITFTPGPMHRRMAISVEIDDQKLTLPAVTTLDTKIRLAHLNGTWKQSEPLPPSWKGPHRNGPFKDAFRHRMMFVYGTQGTPEENAWAYAKARFDAEAFWYRGNGSIDIIPDTRFDPRQEKDRGIILYGNADSNSAWQKLLQDSPVQVKRGKVRIGAREYTDEGLACVFLRPRIGSNLASVGVVSGSGITGMRLTDRIPYFLAGVALPDCTVFGAEVLEKGGESAKAAGFFGEDWGVESGEFVYQ